MTYENLAFALILDIIALGSFIQNSLFSYFIFITIAIFGWMFIKISTSATDVIFIIVFDAVSII